MSSEPTFPAEATPGGPQSAADQLTPPGSGTPAAPPGAESAAQKDKLDAATRNRTLVTGAAIGIGSAALVAALMYARSKGKVDKGPGGSGPR